MKKKYLSLFLAFLLLLSLAACGGSSNGGSDSNTSSAPQPHYTANSDMAAAELADAPQDMGWEESGAPLESYSESHNGLPAGTKMIYTADVELESKEFDDAVKAITAAVTEMNGYFESRSISQGGRYRSLSCTVRVPAENYLGFLDLVGETAHMTHRSDYSDDVSEAYYDEEARLTTQRTKLERLQELLSQAEDMADIITIESAISETELEIEYLTGSLRKYDSLINYSTVNLNLYEVYRLSTDEEVPMTFGERFANAFLTGFENGLAALDDLVIAIARNWLTLLIWVAVIAVAAVLIRRHGKRRKAAKLAASIPAPVPEKTGEDQADDEK